MNLAEINHLSLALKRLERQGINTIRQAQIVLCLANCSACTASVPDVCLYTGLQDDTVRASMQNLERKGIVKPLDSGSRAVDWQLTSSMWDVITGRR